MTLPSVGERSRDGRNVRQHHHLYYGCVLNVGLFERFGLFENDAAGGLR